MLIYKFNVMKQLGEKGYSSTFLRREKIFAESTMQKFRNNIVCSAPELDKLCRLLQLQPGDIIEWVEE